MATQTLTVTHPLEPLAASEVLQAVELLKTLASFNVTTRVISITLKEPRKQAVNSWKAGDAFERKARAVCFDNSANQVFMVDLDLSNARVDSVQNGPEGAQPTMSIDEQIECLAR